MIAKTRELKEKCGLLLLRAGILPPLDRLWARLCVPSSERIGSAQIPPTTAVPQRPAICSHEDTVMVRLWPRRIDRCRTCRVAFQRDGALPEEFDEHYYRRPTVTYFTSDDEPNMHHPKVHAALMERCGLKLESGRDSRLLEVGFANGSVLKYFHDLGWEVCGVEISEWAVQYVREKWGFEVYQGDIRDVDLPASSFDLVALMMILEHHPDPLGVVKCCVDLLRPGGMLFLTVPDSEADAEDYDTLLHHWYFNQYALQYLLCSLGLEGVQVYREPEDMKLINLPILVGAGRRTAV